jgi:hypothetical protein
MKHWHCDTHGDFDACIAVGCPECVRSMRSRLAEAERLLRTCPVMRGSFNWFRDRDNWLAGSATAEQS